MNFSKFISYLFHSRTQAHVFHLQVTGEGSFATHSALNVYYDEIIGLADGLVESYQGKYGILTGYSSFNLMQYESCEEIQNYFKALLNTVESGRAELPQDSYIQNQIDGVVELITSTLYKLTYLK
jgi:hypothetical protein